MLYCLYFYSQALFQYQNQKNKDKDHDSENTIVWVATPPFELAYIARQILEYGNNVVVEAPGGSFNFYSKCDFTIYTCTQYTYYSSMKLVLIFSIFPE